MEVKQPRERLGTLEAILGGFILSVLLSFFLFFFVHGWAVLFFLAFLAACLAYTLYNSKPKESDAPDLVAYPVDKKARKKYMWADNERIGYEIQTNARGDAILANAEKKEKYNIPITWISYEEEILNEIKRITGNKDQYYLIKI